MVFAHAGAMFSFFALDIKTGDLANPWVFFRTRLGKALFDENYPQAVIEVFNNEAVMGAHFRRGSYLAFPGSPMNRMRDMLLRLEELQGVEIP